MIWQVDTTLGNMILVALSSRPERKIYAARCDGSGVKLLPCTLSATTSTPARRT